MADEPAVARTLAEIVAQARKHPHGVVLPKGRGPRPEGLADGLCDDFIRYPTDLNNVWCFRDEDQAVRFCNFYGGRRMDAR